MASEEVLNAVKVNLLRWAQAVDLTRKRVTDADAEDLTRQTDARLLAVSIRNVLRAAAWAGRVAEAATQPQIQKAIREFNAAVPKATGVRNVLEHFDWYGPEGKDRGDLSNPIEFYVRFEDQYALHLADDLALDVQSWSDAALLLADEVLAALGASRRPSLE